MVLKTNVHEWLGMVDNLETSNADVRGHVAGEELDALPPVLTMAGLQRLFGKSRRAVEMMVITDKIGSYKDGRVTLCYVIDAVKLWGDPRKGGA